MTGVTGDVAFVDDSPPFHGKKLCDRVLAETTYSYKWIRTTTGAGFMTVNYGISKDNAIEYSATTAAGMTLAAFQDFVMKCKDNKVIGTLYIHTVRPNGAPGANLNWDLPVFQQCMEWLATIIAPGVFFSATTKILDQMFGNVTVPA